MKCSTANASSHLGRRDAASDGELSLLGRDKVSDAMDDWMDGEELPSFVQRMCNTLTLFRRAEMRYCEISQHDHLFSDALLVYEPVCLLKGVKL